MKTANYFRDGRVVVESVGVGRFKVFYATLGEILLFLLKVNEVQQIDGYDSATFVAIIDQPPRQSELNRLSDLLNQVCSYY